MKQVFVASLCREGVLGGGIFAGEEGFVFKTGKVSVSPRLRHLEIIYGDVRCFSRKRVFLFPVFTFDLKNGETWRFIVFASKRFSALLNERIRRTA